MGRVEIASDLYVLDGAVNTGVLDSGKERRP